MSFLFPFLLPTRMKDALLPEGAIFPIIGVHRCSGLGLGFGAEEAGEFVFSRVEWGLFQRTRAGQAGLPESVQGTERFETE